MALLGQFVAARFIEERFVPVREQGWGASLSTFRRGLALTRRDREILLVFAATAILNGAGVVTWLFPRRLVDAGFPNDPVLWYTALGILSSGAGIVALRVVAAHLDGVGVARRTYALSCLIGVLGLLVLASAPNAIVGGLGVLLVSGIAFNVTRTVSVIWVNGRTTSDVRATVHSFLSQAETIGEIGGGVALAILAQAAGIPATLVTAGALIACTGLMVLLVRSRAGTERHEAGSG
jgi:predicted MFS family arabinose efflux permease